MSTGCQVIHSGAYFSVLYSDSDHDSDFKTSGSKTTHWCCVMCNHKATVCELNQTDTEAQTTKNIKDTNKSYVFGSLC